jgi:2-C-methyl-D-erythritol 4-phosphate cytidylyltransferase
MITTSSKLTITSEKQCWAIVPAAGVGSRMGTTIPKQYLELNGRTVIEHSVRLLLKTNWVTKIIVAISANDEQWQSLEISKHPRVITVLGGDERVDSVSNALSYIEQLAEETEEHFVLVHDAARPCLRAEDLTLLKQSMQTAKSGLLLADKVTDTIKADDGNNSVSKTVPREALWRALTPQVFPLKLLIQALTAAGKSNGEIHITDEASAVEALGLSPLLIQGRSDNIKITKTDDLLLASLILKTTDLK